MKQAGRAAFAQTTGVSHETLERLQAYVDLLLLWNQKINLVAKSTADDVWTRHVLDSAQLFPLIPPQTKSLLDMGSGAGFPGLVLAILGVPNVHLGESDQRKCAFLREAARITGAAVTIHPQRLENISAFPADVITARALAPLEDLLGWAEAFLRPGGRCLFLKGQNVEAELTNAHQIWKMRVILTPSLTDSRASVLCIQEVSRVSADPPDPGSDT